jgi:hypothetical protein
MSLKEGLKKYLEDIDRQNPWEDELTEDPLDHVERLKAILISRAKNGQPAEKEFAWLRRQLISNEELKPLVPTFLSQRRTLSEFWNFISGMFDGDGSHRKRADYLESEFKPLLDRLEGLHATPVDDSMDSLLSVVDRDHVRRAWSKAADRRAHDPDGAVTMAQTLVETVCKHILDEARAGYEKSDDIGNLLPATLKVLELRPEEQSNPWVRQVCQGCRSIVTGVHELRKTDSDSKGVGTDHDLIDPIFAEFAVNAAGALSAFLIGAWEKK